jgi:hypothetical protein
MLDVIGPDGEIWYRIDVPILGTIRECEPTDYGWRGIMPNGSVMETRSDPSWRPCRNTRASPAMDLAWQVHRRLSDRAPPAQTSAARVEVKADRSTERTRALRRA